MAFLKTLGKYKDLGLLLIRVGLGIIFIYHGLPKLIAGPIRWEKLGNAAGAVGIHFLPTFWGLMCAVAAEASSTPRMPLKMRLSLQD